MDHVTLSQLFLLFLFAIPIGIYAILFGGALFLSLPLFQILFPGALVGSIVSNIKVGSVFRNGMALYGGREALSFSFNKTTKVAIPLVLGTIVGSLGIISLSQIFIIPILIIAIIVTEISGTTISLIPNYFYTFLAFLTGFYIGIFGAGSFVSIVALLHIKNTEKNIAKIRMEALLLEFILAIISVSIFFFGGRINISVAFAWTAGSLIGGYLGGKIVKHTAKLSSKKQKYLLRITFALALIIALWNVFAR